MSFRENLQYLRGTRNMTQEQLAMLLGVSRQAISKWESEKAYPEMDKLLMICDLFGVTLDDLVMGDVRRPNSGIRESTADTSTNSGSVGVVAAIAQPVGFAAASSSLRNQAESSASTQDAPTALQADHPAAAPRSAAASRSAMPQDMVGYDRHMKIHAWLTALGVAAMILGVAAGMLFDSENSIIGHSPMNEFLTAAPIILGVIVGCALLIPAGALHGDFQRRHPYIQDFYTDDDRSRAVIENGIGKAVGVGLIMVGVCVMVYCNEVLGINNGWPVSIMLALVAIAVFCFIFTGMRLDRTKLGKHNRESEERNAEGDSAEDDFESPSQPMSVTDKYYNKLTGAVCGIIMLIATVMALLMLFVGVNANAALGGDPSFWGAVFWIPWPIGGILCGVAGAVIQLLKYRNGRR